MLTQVLSSSIWQTIGTWLAIGGVVAASFFFLRSGRSAKEKIIISGVIAGVTVLIIVVAGLGVAVLTPSPSQGASGTHGSATITGGNQISPSATSTTTPSTSSPDAKLFTCVSGAICTSYPINIWIKSITINADNTATWYFQIQNGGNSVNVYLNIYLDNGGMQYGVWKLQPNESESIAVPMNAAPIDGSVHKIIFALEGSFPENIYPEYTHSCTYSASQKTCQP